MNYFKSPPLLKGACSCLLLAATSLVQAEPGHNLEARNRVVGEIVWMASYDCDGATMLHADGALLMQSQYPQLFSVLGKTYGGSDSEGTFGLPDLRGSIAVGVGQGSGLAKYSLGDSGGKVNRPVAPENTPAHSHGLSTVTASMQASKAAGNRKQAVGHYFAKSEDEVYAKSSHSPSGGVMAVVSGASASNPSSDPLAITGQTPFLALTPCVVVAGQGE